MPSATRPSRRPIAALRAAAAIFVAASIWLIAPAAVAAHAELVESTPAANASVLESPDELELHFTEPVDPELVFVDLLDAQRQPVEGLGDIAVEADGRVARLGLPHLPDGVYTVSYQVVSTVDGHASIGSFAFVVDPTGTQGPPSAGPAATTPAVDARAVAARWLGLTGALVALGALVVWFRGRHHLPPAAAHPPWLLVGVAGAVAFAGLAGYLWLSARPIVEAVPDRAGGFPLDFAAPYGGTPFANAMRLAMASSVLTAVVALVARQLLRGRRSTVMVVAAVATSAAALLGMSLSAHAAAIGGIGAAAIDWVHLVAVAAWLGGLPAVAVLARRRWPDGTRSGAFGMLRHHGPMAMVAAPIVAITGIANSPLVLGSSRELVASEYGNLLLAKVVLLSVAVAIGAVNHFALRGRGRAPVMGLVAGELIVAVLAVSVAATMVTVQPASARQPTLETTPVAPAHLFGEAGPVSVHASVDVPTPGPQRYLVTLADAESGQPRDDIQLVFLEITPPPGSDLPPARVDLAQDPSFPTLYAADGAYLSIEGDWMIDVVVRRGGALDERVGFEVPVTTAAPPQLVPPPDTGVGAPGPLAFLWSFIPGGVLGWLPGAAALGALVIIGGVTRGRGRPVTEVARGLLVAIALLGILAAGTRTLVAAVAAPTAEQLAEHEPPASFTASLEQGEAVYLANCAACHGTEGDGDGPVRTLPDAGGLAGPVGSMSPAELSYRIANGVAGTAMPPFAATLTEDERWHLVTYLEDRWTPE
jgi:copper transport protein